MGDKLTINRAATISLVAPTTFVSKDGGVTTILQIEPKDRAQFDDLLNRQAEFIWEDDRERREFAGTVSRIVPINTTSVQVEIVGGYQSATRR